MNFLKDSKYEPRLIDIISFFYFFQVLFYTANDFKFNYPTELIILGLVFHTIAVFVWTDHKLPNSRVKSKRLKELLYKSLIFGLVVTYTLSIRTGILRGELNHKAVDNLILFGITIIPMLIYFYHVGFKRRKNPRIKLLTQKNRILNIIYAILFAGIMVLGNTIT
ncbi:MAG: hypothetical protein RIA69_20985 [Cyclobacteriaceae bacterium]